MARSRHWCFTLNNYTEQDENEIFDLAQNKEVKYGIVGREVGEANGTPHLQGYLSFKETKSLKQCVQLFSSNPHWEMAEGNSLHNQKYCSKEEDYFEWGQRPLTRNEISKVGGESQIERWDLARLKASEGKFEEIPADIYIRNDNALHRIHMREISKHVTTIDGPLLHEWWYGPSGTGKTQTADAVPGAYRKDPAERWWDGYNGEETVIIDDFDKYQVKQSGDMKRWLDRYAFQAPVKGGYVLIRPKKIIVTSNYHPSQIWEDEVTRQCILRRVNLQYFPSLIPAENRPYLDYISHPLPYAPTYQPLEERKENIQPLL